MFAGSGGPIGTVFALRLEGRTFATRFRPLASSAASGPGARRDTRHRTTLNSDASRLTNVRASRIQVVVATSWRTRSMSPELSDALMKLRKRPSIVRSTCAFLSAVPYQSRTLA